MVIGLWGAVAIHSPFWVAIGKALVQLALEYGIVLERWLPNYMEGLLYRLEHKYLPKIKYAISWIPFLRTCLTPKGKQKVEQSRKRTYGQADSDDYEDEDY